MGSVAIFIVSSSNQMSRPAVLLEAAISLRVERSGRLEVS